MITAETPSDTSVAHAAPSMPMPSVYMKIGSSTMFRPAPSTKTYIARFASPSLRRIALATFTKNIIMLPAKMIRAYATASSVVSEAPTRTKISLARRKNGTEKPTASSTIIMIVWIATLSAPRFVLSPDPAGYGSPATDPKPV